MNRIAVPGFIFILLIFAFLGPQPAAAQSGGGAVVGISGPGVQWKPKLEINREPIPTLRLATELVEILPGETRRLAFDSGEDTGGSLTAFPSPYALVAGGTASGSLGMKAGVPIHYSLKVVQLDKDGLVLDIKISDESKTVLATRTLALKNYDEALIEFASTANGERRLALRFLPTIIPIPPVQDYPALVPSLTLSGLLIRNGYELISRGGSTRGTVDDLSGTKLQFFTFHSQRTGFLVMSYRPFPGARVAGYFEDKKLIFEWNGDSYEYFSLDKPFMPEGRWAAWFWEAGPSSGSGMGIGGFEADPNTGELADRANQMMQMIERMRQARR
jgi:hypothetical protein